MIDRYEAMMAYHRAENDRASAEDRALLANIGVRVILETVGVTYDSDRRKRIDLQASAARYAPSPLLPDS